MGSYNPTYAEIAAQFVQHFYTNFDNRAMRVTGLKTLYDETKSFLTFEGTQLQGREAIMNKFESLPFEKIQHLVTKVDSQPLPDGSVLVCVFGQLKTDDDVPNSFNHTFVLAPSGGGPFVIVSEVFRLILHDS